MKKILLIVLLVTMTGCFQNNNPNDKNIERINTYDQRYELAVEYQYKVIQPELINNEYHYVTENLGFKMIFDFKLPDKVYVVETFSDSYDYVSLVYYDFDEKTNKETFISNHNVGIGDQSVKRSCYYTSDSNEQIPNCNYETITDLENKTVVYQHIYKLTDEQKEKFKEHVEYLHQHDLLNMSINVPAAYMNRARFESLKKSFDESDLRKRIETAMFLEFHYQIAGIDGVKKETYNSDKGTMINDIIKNAKITKSSLEINPDSEYKVILSGPNFNFDKLQLYKNSDTSLLVNYYDQVYLIESDHLPEFEATYLVQYPTPDYLMNIKTDSITQIFLSESSPIEPYSKDVTLTHKESFEKIISYLVTSEYEEPPIMGIEFPTTYFVRYMNGNIERELSITLLSDSAAMVQNKGTSLIYHSQEAAQYIIHLFEEIKPQ